MINNAYKERIKEEYGTVKNLVERVMEKHPQTRNGDTALYLTCLEELGVNTVEEAKLADLNIVTIHKIRQVVQNKEGRFLPKEEVKLHRDKRESVIREIHKDYK